jgi:3-oxoacyl-[acyl-carrier-protein] synthase II
MYSRRIVITGLGAVTPLGNDVGEFWDALIQGRSGVAPLESFETGDFSPNYAAEVKSFSAERAGLPRRKLKMMGRHAQLALAAAKEAMRDARLVTSSSSLASSSTADASSPAVDSSFAKIAPERLGVMLGVGMLNADETEMARAFHATRQATNGGAFGEGAGELFDMVAFGKAGVPQMFPLWLLRHIPNMPCAHVSIALDARSASNTIMTGCVAAASAIGEAARVIARGDADAMLAGGTDARVNPLAVLRYRDLGWLATRRDVDPATVSTPFDEQAAGFVNGEGAGVLVLESMEHAQARGARIYAELLGYSAANDAYDLLRPHPEGRGLARAFASCLKKCNTESVEIDAVFAPATSVPSFDRAGATALKTVFRSTTMRTLLTATRSALGHTHAASAALDCIAACKAIIEGELPPIINLRRPIADFAFVTDSAQRVEDLKTVLIGAYGFGGHAAALVLRRCA